MGKQEGVLREALRTKLAILGPTPGKLMSASTDSGTLPPAHMNIRGASYQRKSETTESHASHDRAMSLQPVTQRELYTLTRIDHIHTHRSALEDARRWP